MNKMIIMIGMGVGSTLGALVPFMWGDSDIMSGASIVWGLAGGFLGIWLGVKIAKLAS